MNANEKKARSKMKHDLLLRCVKAVNVLLLTIPFAWCWFSFYADQVEQPIIARQDVLLITIFVILYCLFARVYEALLVSLHRISEMIYSQVLAAMVADGISYLIITLLTRRFTSLIPGIEAIAAQFVLSVIWSLCAHWWYFAVFAPKKSMVIYDAREGMEQLLDEYGLSKKFEVIDVVPVEECLKNLDRLEGLEAVFLSDIHSHDRNVILKYCVEHHVSMYLIPRVGDILMSGAKPMHMFHLPILRVERYNPAPEYLLLKRISDVVLSGMATVVLSPVILITSAAIKLYDRGPVFYKQVRLTKDGKEFEVLKFRSMKVDAEKDGVARLSSGENDPRITPVGRVIRKCRVDELPQLFNILKGDMSIVGPRPERPSIAAEYEKVMPEFRLRLQAKAGLTGYAQVYGKYNTTPYDKLQMDLMYISHPSILEDFRIMFATVKILFLPESTEGVAEGQTTAMSEEKTEKK